MRIVELTRDTWPALETLFSANKTVGGCWCCWFMRPRAEVDVNWARTRAATAVKGHPVDTEGEKRGSGDLHLGTLALSGPPVSGLSEQRRRLGAKRPAPSSAGREDTGCRPANRRAERGNRTLFLAAGFDLVDRWGTRRALVRRSL